MVTHPIAHYILLQALKRGRSIEKKLFKKLYLPLFQKINIHPLRSLISLIFYTVLVLASHTLKISGILSVLCRKFFLFMLDYKEGMLINMNLLLRKILQEGRDVKSN